MRLSDLVAAAVAAVRVGSVDPEVESIAYDSRSVVAGALFCCIKGERADGHDHAGDAWRRGAVALLVDHELDLDVAQIVVSDTRQAMALLASTFENHPSDALCVIGVTGTNGKTTTVTMLAEIFRAAGRRAGLIGTLTGERTTPEAPDLQRQLAEFLRTGNDTVAMEVTSHGLAQHRVDGTTFAVGVFTNLSRDHLDFHETMAAYFAAKARLFEPGRVRHAVINVDDPYGQLLADTATVPVTPYSMVDAGDLVVGAKASTFVWRGERLDVPVGGRFNVSNALAAATTASVVGVEPSVIANGLRQATTVPGRFETVSGEHDITVVVDYAHTPDGLDQVLSAAREISGQHRVLVVFGCGGDRDATKRPAMGEVAARLADVAIITSDNPRSEDPGAIISAVKGGVPVASRARVVVEPERRAAIALAIDEARRGDVIVIAGKGHETTQTIGTKVLPFDDRAVARELLEAHR